jgi:hypothetical protein
MINHELNSVLQTDAGPQPTDTDNDPPPVTAAQAGTATTRYMCTGVYIDRAFRDMVVGKVRNDPVHRTAPSYGFDLIAVTYRAWQAWLLETGQQACMLAALIAALILDRQAVVVAACGVGIMYLAWMSVRVAPRVIRLQTQAMAERWLRRRGLVADHDDRREQSRRFTLCWAGCAVLMLIAVVAAWHDNAPSRHVTAAVVLLGVLACVSAAVGAVRQLTLNRFSRKGRLRPAKLSGRLAIIADQQDCRYAVYHRPPADSDTRPRQVPSADYEPLTPFVGSGILVHRWLPPINVQLLRPGDGDMVDLEHPVPPFKTHELVQSLKKAMEPAGQDPERLRGFQVADRLYVDERVVDQDRGFLRSRGSPADIDDLIDDPHSNVHHYLEIQLSTTGELVTTALVRVTVRGRSLSLDFQACALTRTPDEYHVLDRYHETGPGAVLRSALRGVYTIPAAVGGLWRLVKVPWVLARATWARKDRTLAPRRRRLIGTRLSIREEKAETWEDAEMDYIAIYDDVKIIEQRLLKATEDFLKSKDVDTSVLEKRAFNIISMGILNMGKLEMHQAAVGPNAQFNTDNSAAAGSGSSSGDGPQNPGGGQS